MAFALHLLDVGDEELPGALGVREVQGGLAQADQEVGVLDSFFAVDTILPDLQKQSKGSKPTAQKRHVRRVEYKEFSRYEFS